MKTNAPILFVTASLGAGGAERVLSLLANAWAEAGHPITIVTLSGGEAAPFYAPHPTIRVRNLDLLKPATNLFGAIASNLSRLLALRRALREIPSNAVISFGTETNVLVLLAALGLGRKVVVSERCDPNFYPESRPWRWLRRLTYPLASRLVVQTQAAKNLFKNLSHRTLVIANPIEAPVAQGALEGIATPFVMAVGRLVPQKGFDLLLEAFGRLAEDFPEHRLILLGEGSARGTLEAKALALGVAERVCMPGVVSNPGTYMQAADAFVLSSRFEGFPNALCEAMANGLAVISTDCPSGPAEIIEDGKDGILVPVEDVEALAAAMRNLLKDPSLRRKMGQAGKTVATRFSIAKALAAWERALG